MNKLFVIISDEGECAFRVIMPKEIKMQKHKYRVGGFIPPSLKRRVRKKWLSRDMRDRRLAFNRYRGRHDIAEQSVICWDHNLWWNHRYHLYLPYRVQE